MKLDSIFLLTFVVGLFVWGFVAPILEERKKAKSRPRRLSAKGKVSIKVPDFDDTEKFYHN